VIDMSAESEDRMRRAKAILARMRGEDAEGLARYTDPDTSHEAARGVSTTLLKQIILLTLKDYGHPMAMMELATANAMGRDSLSPRRPAMIEEGTVVEMGRRSCVNANGNVRSMIAIGLPEWVIELPVAAE
jgi:hypothetical protein